MSYDRHETWSFRSTAYYRNTTVPDDTIPIIELPTEDSAGRQYRYYRPNSLIGNETQFRWTPDPRWRFSFGLVLEQERLAETISITESAAADVQPPAPADPNMLKNRLISVYAQSQISLSKTIDLFLGVRHDDSNYYGAVTTPRLGFVFNRGKLTAKILYMQAFRAPKPWDYTNGSGNPNLKPEKIYFPGSRRRLVLFRLPSIRSLRLPQPPLQPPDPNQRRETPGGGTTPGR